MHSLFLYVWYQPLQLSYLLFQSFLNCFGCYCFVFCLLICLFCFVFSRLWKSKLRSSISSYLTAWCMTGERWRYSRTAILHCSPSFLSSPVLESAIKSYFSIYLENLSYGVHMSTSKVWWSGSDSYWDLNFHSVLYAF